MYAETKFIAKRKCYNVNNILKECCQFIPSNKIGLFTLNKIC